MGRASLRTVIAGAPESLIWLASVTLNSMSFVNSEGTSASDRWRAQGKPSRRPCNRCSRRREARPGCPSVEASDRTYLYAVGEFASITFLGHNMGHSVSVINSGLREKTLLRSIERRRRVNPEHFRGEISDLPLGVQRTARPTHRVRSLFVGRTRHSVRAGLELSYPVRNKIATENVTMVPKQIHQGNFITGSQLGCVCNLPPNRSAMLFGRPLATARR